MKNYVIGTLIAIIMVLGSILIKKEMSPDTKFPVTGETASRKDSNVQVPMYLYVFFTKRNCHDCLEFIKVLNELPSYFIVTGIVPEDELKDEMELRNNTGATFPLESLKKYRKYIPWYTPGIVGVSSEEDILFELPGVPGEKEYLETFLNSLYGKLYPILLKAKLSQNTR